MLSQLPTELLQAVIEQVTDKRDLKSLCEVSRYIYHSTLPILYRTITISRNEAFLDDPVFDLVSLGSMIKHSGLVRAFALEALFHDVLINRCPHIHSRPDLDSLRGLDNFLDHDEFSNSHIDWITRFGDNLIAFFDSLTENSLRSFSWNLGTCIPAALLGKNGHLPKHQRNIEHLSLMTNGQCQFALGGDSPLDLSQFNRLKTFSWRGLRSVEDFEALQGFFAASSSALEGLTIDLGCWIKPDYFWFSEFGIERNYRSPNFFAREILKIERGGMFPFLESLSFCAVSFKSAVPEMISALNIRALRSLKLWNCPGMFELLNEIATSDQVMRLTCFELAADFGHSYNGGDELFGFFKYQDSMEKFLQKCQGLEDLCLLYPAGINELADSIARHHSTLKRLVLHERDIDPVENSPRFGRLCDGEIAWHGEIEALFANLDLEFLGVSNEPGFLKHLLALLTAPPTFKILHVRSSRNNCEHMPDYEFFNTLIDIEWSNLEREKAPGCTVPPELSLLAQWAFGPGGLPGLQILAYGDFSHNGRYAEHNMLFCRKPPSELSNDGSNLDFQVAASFRCLTADDTYLQDLLSRNMEVLEACAVDNVMPEI